MSLLANIDILKQVEKEIHELNVRVSKLREKKHAIVDWVLRQPPNILAELPTPIKIQETHVYEPLTFKYLERALTVILSNEEQRNKILSLIHTQRSVKTNRIIKL